MCPFTVRVRYRCCLADFLDSLFTSSISATRGCCCTFGFRLGGWICLLSSLLTSFNRLFRQTAAVSRLCLHVTRYLSNGILTVSSIGLAIRLILRTRLTPGRLTLPGKPWSYGESASHTLYRYLYLHLLFHALQKGLSPHLRRTWNAPLPILSYPAASAAYFIPDYYPRTVPRLVSCYALFE